MNELIKQGTKDGVIEVVTPLIHLSKKEIINKTFDLNAPIEHTWSCYDKEAKACGVCDSCALRLRGFEQAGKEDPIEYEKRPSYLN